MIQQVLDVWTPRFLVGGIAIGDLVDTVGRMTTWDDWAPEWMTTASMHERRAAHFERAGQTETATGAYLLASRCYHMAYFVAVRDEALHQAGLSKMLQTHERARPNLHPAVERVDFVADGVRCVALLSTPAGSGPHPVVILLPGLDSTKETRHGSRARWLARRVAVLSMDGPGQGEASQWSVVRPDYEVAVSAALDWIGSRPDLDEGRVGLVGASLAGYYAPRAAAYDRRVRATIANCGPYDWAACWDGLPVVTQEAFMRYSGSASLTEARDRATAFTLAGVAEHISTPLIVFHGEADPLIPWPQGEQLAREAGGEFVLVERGNHGLNNYPYSWIPRSLDWMVEHLR